MSRNVSSHDVSNSILELVEGNSSPVQKMIEFAEIPDNVDMGTEAIR